MVKRKQGKRGILAGAPGPNLNPKNDAELIDALDGAAALRKALAQVVGGLDKAPTRLAINMWKYRDIAPDWRPVVAKIAEARGITLYENFLAPAVVRKGSSEAAPAA